MNELDTRPALTIQDCMALVMGDVREVAKSDRNEQQHFTFRGVDAVVNAVAPALRKHGVIVTPHETAITYEPLVTKNGTQMMCSRVLVTYRFTGPGGDFMEAQVAGEAFDAGDKGTAKAMSVAFRIALLQALALPTDDTDPDTFSYDRADGTPPAVGSVTSEGTTANANSVPSADAKSGRAAGGVAAPSEVSAGANASPAVPEGAGSDREATIAYGEGATDTEETDPAPSSHHLSKDDQSLLKAEFGGQVAAIKAYQAWFPGVTKLSDITYEMRDEMAEVSV